MWTEEQDDELKNKLKWDVTMWYKAWYMGNDNALYRHLELLEEHYNPRDFDNEDTLHDDIVKFLNYLQELINKEGIE